MKCGESGVAFQRGPGQERKSYAGPDEMDAHEERHRQAEKNAEQREPEIVQPNHFVVGAEQSAPQEAGLRRFCLICCALVVGHGSRTNRIHRRGKGKGRGSVVG